MKPRDEVSCPICDADIPVAGDEKAGEEVFCTFCSAPFVITGKDDEGMLEIDEDY